MTVWGPSQGPFDTVGGHDPTSSSGAGNDNTRIGLPVTLTNSPNHGTFRVIRPLADHINGSPMVSGVKPILFHAVR